MIQSDFEYFKDCSCKITCKPMRNCAENLKLGKGVRHNPDPGIDQNWGAYTHRRSAL